MVGDESNSDGEQTIWSDSDRKRGILTKQDRRYLLGEAELSGQDERNARYRIRQRASQALLDITLLTEKLPKRDLKQVIDSPEIQRTPECPINLIALAFELLKYDDKTTDTISELERMVENVVEVRTEVSSPPDGTVEAINSSVKIDVTREEITPQMIVETLLEISDEAGKPVEDIPIILGGRLTGDVDQVKEKVRKELEEKSDT